jgi:nitrate reductase NapAB chaperone NapD
MNISGIVVSLDPGTMDAALARLGLMEGVEVHQVDLTSHRAVITQEACSTEEQERGLSSIQAMPGVLDAMLVYHWFGDANP